LDMGALEGAMTSIIASGDKNNEIRSTLASQLGLKAAQARYEAFLRRAPGLIAEHARRMRAEDVLVATSAWREASALAARAVALSLDKQSVVFQMGSLLASLQPHKQSS
ncbi:MAG: DNA polymerase III subunit delta', partial [Sphingorhabdus sp.]